MANRPRTRVPSRARALALLAALASGIAGARAQAEPAAHTAAALPARNVVLITVDALRADRMSLYGHARPTTPRLDAFAREAAVFENFFAVSAHTSPGVVSLLTAQAPPVHAQTTQFSFYDALIPSPLRLLGARGYDVVGYAIRGPTYEGLGFTRGQEGKPSEQLLSELASGGKPFLVWLHARETHLPYQPAPEFAGRFTRGLSLDSPLLRAVRAHTLVLRHPPPGLALRHAGDVAATAGDAEPLRALYDECVASADARVGTWLDEIRALGLLERTIVVVTADHGEELLEHGWVGHASTGYDGKLADELQHVPLIVRLPGGAYAGRYRALASQVDVMPTLLALLGVDGSALAPNEQGESLVPVLRGEAAEVRPWVFAETTRKGWTTPRDEARDRVAAIREGGRWVPVPARVDEAHRAAARRIAHAAALAHLALAEAALARDDAVAVVAQWQALARIQATWGLERSPFYEDDAEWQSLRVRAAELAARAMRCDARGLSLSSRECRADP
ncbi:MAG TPA: sulfatase [Myxococcota bacterium]|jgi:arylsulfatase A-like enzyme